MGKKSGRSNNGGGDDDAPKPTAFVLKVPMHCRCDGCGDKIRAAVKDLANRCAGIQSLDQSALGTTGELAVVATADPERLRRRLRKATGKSVDLVFPKQRADVGGGGNKDDAAAAAAFQALLLAGLRQQQQQQPPVHAHHGQPMPMPAGWNAHALQQGQGGYGQAAYPWVLQPSAPPEPYFTSYPAAAPAYPPGAYPHDGLGGAYAGGGWFGY